MSSQVQPLTGTDYFRLVSPAITVDAAGGVVAVVNNAKFNTNTPLDRYMLVRRVDWYLTHTVAAKYKHVADASQASAHVEYQLTEALARTTVTFADPVYVDEGLVEETGFEMQATAASIGFSTQYVSHPITHYPFWASAAQQFNILGRWNPLSVTILSAGPTLSLSCVIEYQLLQLSADVRAYLANRVQIAGQA